MWAARSRSILLQQRCTGRHLLGGSCLPTRPTGSGTCTSKHPTLEPARQWQLQVRYYYYFPSSFEEFRERFQRWIEKADQRFVKVKLVSRQRRRKRRHQLYRFVGRTQARWNSWFQKHRQTPVDSSSTYSTLPLPAVTSSSDDLDQQADTSTGIQSQYHGWKATRKEQYQGWKLRRKEQYQRWKLRRQAQYQGWKRRRQKDWLRTKQIILNEYSKPEWFDGLGRPLTSKDSIGRYVNPWQSQSTNGLHSIATLLSWRWQRFRREFSLIGGIGSLVPKLSWTTTENELVTQTEAQPLPKDPNILSMTWVGHSTCWIQVEGFTVLTDPIFSLRSSPYQAIPIGVPREVPPSHSIEQLVHHGGGTIDFCCITHDHYDHMDRDSIELLAPYVSKWIVPIGIGEFLIEKCGVQQESIIELEWWQQASFARKAEHSPVLLEDTEYSEGALTITCCPASHWASRTMLDRNYRLWCSFALTGPTHRVFFCGDTGYPTFPLFRQIADTLGPFDLSCIPIGAYDPPDLNKDAHVNPEEAVQIHKDLKSRHSVGIHWGTFALGEEPLSEPPLLLLAALQSERTMLPPFETVSIGSTIQVDLGASLTEASANDDDGSPL